MTFETGKGKSSGHYTGVLLWSWIEGAGVVDDAGKNANLKHTLLITGRDGYAVALAVGELDPHYEGKSVILASRAVIHPHRRLNSDSWCLAMPTAAPAFAT